MSQPRPQPRDRGFNAACSSKLRKFSETHNIVAGKFSKKIAKIF